MAGPSWKIKVCLFLAIFRLTEIDRNLLRVIHHVLGETSQTVDHIARFSLYYCGRSLDEQFRLQKQLFSTELSQMSI